jgi:Domain of unknown function (DUF4365)
VALAEQVIFARYVHEHLRSGSEQVERFRTYRCPACSIPFENRETARRRLDAGADQVFCPDCATPIPLRDGIEELFASAQVRAEVANQRDLTDIVLDKESRDRVLVGDIASTVDRADQISHERAVNDIGIEMEIEFVADDGSATGHKLYLHLESKPPPRSGENDEPLVFTIDERHAEQWANESVPVMLVVRHGDGRNEWMEVGDLLRRRRVVGDQSTQITFDGARFDVVSVRTWRERVLNGS